MDTNMSNQNPLLKYVRQPSIYWQLPSHGQWWPKDAIDMPESGQLPVLPMSSRDEILLKTPDALISGEAIVALFQSCIPNIKNAWDMPGIDVDSALISIRIASMGESMNFSSKCPNCSTEADYDIDLRTVLDRIQCPHYVPFEFKNLTFQLKPQRYFNLNANNQLRFVEQSIYQSIANNELDDDQRRELLKEQVAKIEDLNYQVLISSTDYVATPEGVQVSDPEQLAEFYRNAETAIIRRVKNQIEDYAETAGIKPLDLKCSNCEHKYQRDLIFDYSSFFG
jgi:hypothetical protein